MDRIGVAEELVAQEVMIMNQKKELELTLARADDEMEAWLQTEEGLQATPESAEAKRKEVLLIVDGKVGIVITLDGAWQRRTIGKGQILPVQI